MPFAPQQWNVVTDLFAKSLANDHQFAVHQVAVATVNPDGSPHVTPIGSLVLLDNETGLFFDAFLGNTERNLRHDPRISVLAVDATRRSWLRALMTGHFSALPGIRLAGVVGPRRAATSEERERFRHGVRWLRHFKGYDLLWKDLRFVRDVTFDTARPVRLGAMTQGLWSWSESDRAGGSRDYGSAEDFGQESPGGSRLPGPGTRS